MCEENKAVKLIKFMKDNYYEEDESSFWAGLTILKRHTKLNEVRYDSLSELINMLSIVKEDETIAMLIETIVEIPCFDFNRNQKLLDEYLRLILQRDTTNEEAAQCLRAFILSGANKDEIFNKIAKNLDEENAIKILVNVDIELDYWNIEPNELEEFFRNLQIAKRIRYRSGVITSFLSSIYSPLIEYGNIVPFVYHYSNERIALDWDWNEPDSISRLVGRKIVTEKEAEILQRLGALLDRRVETHSTEIKKLYDEFFDDKNPINVMFTLPE
ncbi:hypothetical protein FC961_07875 [Clostridium botulinum]|nr:hypothetical protein [Clostridium botulinum]NFO90991.1 hypothetical protein [Clostridium botulinum]